MKKILLFIGLILFLNSFSAQNEQDLNNDRYKCAESLLKTIMPDTIYSLIENKPILFYTYGHYGYSWSLVTKVDSNNIHAFSGRVSYSGNNHIIQSTESNRLDSIALFSANADIINWGFDTLPTEGLQMEAVKKNDIFWTDLDVINCDGMIIFNSNGATVFTGPDSIIFNKKFQKLCLIMKWLSEPKIRKYIPDSVIFCMVD